MPQNTAGVLRINEIVNGVSGIRRGACCGETIAKAMFSATTELKQGKVSLSVYCTISSSSILEPPLSLSEWCFRYAVCA